MSGLAGGMRPQQAHNKSSVFQKLQTMTRFLDQIPRRIYPQEIMKNLRMNQKNVPKKTAPSLYLPPQQMERITAAPLMPQYHVSLNTLLIKKHPQVSSKPIPNSMQIDRAYTIPQLRLAPLAKTSVPKAPKYPEIPKNQDKPRSTKGPGSPKLPALPEIPPLPKQTYPHELRNVTLNDPLVFHPQPFSFPGYPVVVYLKK